jgi:hypothetical protein
MPQTDYASSIHHRAGPAMLHAALCLGLAGCCGNPQCETPLSNERTPVESVAFWGPWTNPEFDTFRVIVTTGPYRVGDFALEQLRAAMAEQAGLNVTVEDGTDTGLPTGVVVDELDLLEAAADQIPDGDDAVLIVVLVDDSNAINATYGFIETYTTYAGRPLAITGLHRANIVNVAVGPVTPDVIEAGTLIHEVGHWLDVPARAYHTSAVDGVHCTSARCVMFSGGRANACAIQANLCSGYPLRFCPDCAEELAELQARRQQQ